MREDPPLIVDMRAMLANPDRPHMMVTTTGPFPQLGVQPELLSANGTDRVWSLTRAQVAKVVAQWDTHPKPIKPNTRPRANYQRLAEQAYDRRAWRASQRLADLALDSWSPATDEQLGWYVDLVELLEYHDPLDEM
jgi:hypothetical protein